MMMANENCLVGFKCPECGNEDRFGIACDVVFEVTDEGAGEQIGDTCWDDDSYCECRECLKSGSVKDFYTSEPCNHESDNQGICVHCGIAEEDRQMEDLLRTGVFVNGDGDGPNAGWVCDEPPEFDVSGGL